MMVLLLAALKFHGNSSAAVCEAVDCLHLRHCCSRCHVVTWLRGEGEGCRAVVSTRLRCAVASSAYRLSCLRCFLWCFFFRCFFSFFLCFFLSFLCFLRCFLLLSLPLLLSLSESSCRRLDLLPAPAPPPAPPPAPASSSSLPPSSADDCRSNALRLRAATSASVPIWGVLVVR